MSWINILGERYPVSPILRWQSDGQALRRALNFKIRARQLVPGDKGHLIYAPLPSEIALVTRAQNPLLGNSVDFVHQIIRDFTLSGDIRPYANMGFNLRNIREHILDTLPIGDYAGKPSLNDADPGWGIKGWVQNLEPGNTCSAVGFAEENNIKSSDVLVILKLLLYAHAAGWVITPSTLGPKHELPIWPFQIGIHVEGDPVVIANITSFRDLFVAASLHAHGVPIVERHGLSVEALSVAANIYIPKGGTFTRNLGVSILGPLGPDREMTAEEVKMAADTARSLLKTVMGERNG